MRKYPYGTVFKIEREFSEEDIYNHMKKIKGAGFNYVVIWPAVYWWEDRKLPYYPFSTGRRILEYAQELGLKIIMELAGQITSLEYAPDFIMKKEYLPLDYDGHPNENGEGYGFLNYNHPEVKRIVHKMFTEAVENYKSYPSLYGYDIFNETHLTSFDRYTLEVFREWLKSKYKTINKLNNSWDRVYYDWSQIEFTKWIWGSVMPFVDYHQFHKENLGMILKEWCEVVKSVDPLHPCIADNVDSPLYIDKGYDNPHDDWNVAENVDEFGISIYPKNTLPAREIYHRWIVFTGVHSAVKSGGFWVSELQSHNVTLLNPFSVVYKKDIKLWNWEAISHGAKGIIYWKWAPFIKGRQTGGRGLIDLRSNDTPRLDEASLIAKVLDKNDREFMEYVPEQPNAAILYDKLNHDFSKAYSKAHGALLSDTIYIDALDGLYRCLWDNNIPTKFIIPKDIISGEVNKYKVFFISGQIYLNKDLCRALVKYVEQGGTLICDGKFGMVDETGLLLKNIPGGDFNKVLGHYYNDVDPFDLNIKLNWDNGTQFTLKGYYEKSYEDIWGNNVDTLGSFDDGSPAIFRSRYGKGQVLFISTYLWLGYIKERDESVSDFMKLLDKEYNLHTNTIDNNNLKIHTLKGDDGFITFVFNYCDEPISATLELNLIEVDKCTVTNLYTDNAETHQVCNGKLILKICVTGNDVCLYKVSYMK